MNLRKLNDLPKDGIFLIEYNEYDTESLVRNISVDDDIIHANLIPVFDEDGEDYEFFIPVEQFRSIKQISKSRFEYYRSTEIRGMQIENYHSQLKFRELFDQIQAIQSKTSSDENGTNKPFAPDVVPKERPKAKNLDEVNQKQSNVNSIPQPK